MEHLSTPSALNSLLPVGHNNEKKLIRGGAAAAAAAWCCSSLSPLGSFSSPFSWFSLETWSSPLSTVPTSAISPGFLSNSPLNCFRAFFSTSCLHAVIQSTIRIHLLLSTTKLKIHCCRTYLFSLFQFKKCCPCIWLSRLVSTHHLVSPRSKLE